MCTDKTLAMKRLAKVLTIIALLAALSVQAQDVQHEDSDKARLNYGFSKTDLDTAFMRNSASMRRLEGFFNSVRVNPDVSVKNVVITSFASMEGDVISNRRFITERNATARDLVKKLSGLPDSLIICVDGGIAWNHLRDSVDKSNMLYREEVLYIIDNQPEETWKDGTLVDSRRKHLMDLHGGEPYRYMRARFFPYYRYSRIRITYTGTLDEQTRSEIETKPVIADSTDNYGEGIYIEIARDTVQELQDTVKPDMTASAVVLASGRHTGRTGYGNDARHRCIHTCPDHSPDRQNRRKAAHTGYQNQRPRPLCRSSQCRSGSQNRGTFFL